VLLWQTVAQNSVAHFCGQVSTSGAMSAAGHFASPKQGMTQIFPKELVKIVKH